MDWDDSLIDDGGDDDGCIKIKSWQGWLVFVILGILLFIILEYLFRPTEITDIPQQLPPGWPIAELTLPPGAKITPIPARLRGESDDNVFITSASAEHAGTWLVRFDTDDGFATVRQHFTDCMLRAGYRELDLARSIISSTPGEYQVNECVFAPNDRHEYVQLIEFGERQGKQSYEWEGDYYYHIHPTTPSWLVFK